MLILVSTVICYILLCATTHLSSDWSYKGKSHEKLGCLFFAESEIAIFRSHIDVVNWTNQDVVRPRYEAPYPCRPKLGTARPWKTRKFPLRTWQVFVPMALLPNPLAQDFSPYRFFPSTVSKIQMAKDTAANLQEQFFSIPRTIWILTDPSC